MSIDQIKARLSGVSRIARAAPQPLPPTLAVTDPAPDTRRTGRKTTRAPGLIFPGGQMASIPCMVVDQSINGARLQMQAGWVNPFRGESSLRERFTLVMRIDRVEIDCEIVRIEDNEMGVKFLSMMRPLARKI